MPSILSKLCSLHLNKDGGGTNSDSDSDDPAKARASDEESTTSSKLSPWIFSLYKDAAGFESALKKTGCLDSGSDTASENGFDRLIRKDLTEQEKLAAANDAKIGSAMNPSEWFSGPLEHSLSHDLGAHLHVPVVHRLTPHDSESLSAIGPVQIVQILNDEFGPLAPSGEEKMLLEVDGSVLNDVLVMGVIHLTTHRLAFHASLLSEPGKPTHVVKAGPATHHRSGWHTKRRIWMELMNDMMCAYASSKDSDRARPLCTVLINSIKEILPLDPKHPRILRIVRDVRDSRTCDDLEFDTIESAHQWRQEIEGVFFLSRHRRKEDYSSSIDGTNGVRISLPLNRIHHIRRNINTDLPTLVALYISCKDIENFPDCLRQVSEIQKLQIGPITNFAIWVNLEGVINDAKIRAEHNAQADEAPIFVDFGPLCFLRGTCSGSAVPDLEKVADSAVKAALGFKPDSHIWVVPARIYRTLATNGYFTISEHFIGFWSKNLTKRDIKYRLSSSQIGYVRAFHLNWLNVEGVSIGIREGGELKLVFQNAIARDEARKRIDDMTLALSQRPPEEFGVASIARSASLPESSSNAIDILAPISRGIGAAAYVSGRMSQDVRNRLPKAINLPTGFLPSNRSLHFICLTIGSRGDVQPYIALGVRLQSEGHRVTIVTHEEYRAWIMKYGLEHRQAGGDPGRLMKLSVENKIMSPEFFKESMSNFRPWLDELLVDAWNACRDADVLIESPSAMAGVHIAEALKIPYFRSFSMPWTKTTEYPHPFLSPPVDAPTFNSASYVLFSNVMWAATSKQINKWRRTALDLPNTDMGHLSQSKIIFIYFFSQAVVPKPLDWPDTVTISGYWFLADSDPGWTPSQEFLDWMAKARADGKPIVYIGFGSITIPRPRHVMAGIVRAVLKSGVRAIISKGWSTRMKDEDDADPIVEMPPQCFALDNVPHDWLFACIDAALHHGGAGTTAASLRAGIPTLIKPWFGDQFFWASRVQKLGAGLKVASLKSSVLAKALIKATSDPAMREQAMNVGRKIRAEDGVHNAIYTIYTYLHRASQDRKTLVE